MELFSSGKRVGLALAMVVSALAGCSSDSPESLVAAAKAHLEKREFKAAVIQAKNALAKKPDSGEIRFLLGMALLEAGEPANAEVELRRAVELQYSRNEVMPLLMRALVVSGKVGKVIEEAPWALATSPAAKAEVFAWLATAYHARGETALVNKALANALEAQADNATALIISARLKASEGDIAGAIALIDSVSEKATSNVDALKFRGDLLLTQNRAEPAVASYRKAVALRPDILSLQHALAYGLLVQAKFDSKSPAFAEAVKQAEVLKGRAPKHPQTLALETQIAFSQRNLPAARELAAKLLSVAPDAPAALQMAGAIEYSLGSYAQADAYLARALAGAPEVIATRRWLVMTSLSSGNIKKAVAVLEPILNGIETDADMLALAGEVYMQDGDAKKAEELLTKATKLAPMDTSKRIALALTKIGGVNSEAAIADLQQISATDNDTVADMALLATYTRRGQLESALQVLDVLDRKQPNSPRAFNMRGRVLLAMKDSAGARKSYERALAVDPRYFAAAANLAQLDIAEGRLEAAAARYEGVVKANPGSVPALLALAEIKANLNAPRDEIVALINKAVSAGPSDSAPRVALVRYFLSSKDTNKALSTAQDALAALPNSSEILNSLGQVQIATGDLNQALVTYGKILSTQPNAIEPYMRMAEIHSVNKNPEAAAQNLRKVLQIKPDTLEAQRGLIEFDIIAGKPQAAIAMARQVQTQRPEDGIGYMLEGDVHASRKAWNEAVDAYRAALKKGATSEPAMKLYGVLLGLGKRADAEKFGATWLNEHPKDAVFHVYAAGLATVRGDYPAASGYYRAILASQPENPSLLNNLAYVAGKSKQPDALDFAEKANKLAPDQPLYMDTLGVLLAEKGQLDRALELLGKAARAAPQEAGIKLNYVRALVQAGKKTEAKKQLDELAAMGNNFPEQQEVAKLLRQL